jgi:hypothetical protein
VSIGSRRGRPRCAVGGARAPSALAGQGGQTRMSLRDGDGWRLAGPARHVTFLDTRELARLSRSLTGNTCFVSDRQS